MQIDFEFEIGDIVYFKTADHFAGQRPKQFIVVERIAQQCSGGIQLLYKIGAVTSVISEIELSREEPPYRQMSSDEVLERDSVHSWRFGKK